MRRAFPSGDMVVRLVATLDLPLRQRHELRVGVGSFRFETECASPELARARDAFDYMLAQQQS